MDSLSCGIPARFQKAARLPSTIHTASQPSVTFSAKSRSRFRETSVTLWRNHRSRWREIRTYDPTGNLTRINDLQRGELRYSYDPVGQLLSAVQPTLTETFAFDPAGNLLDPKTQGAKSQNDKPLTEQPRPGETAPPNTPKLAKVTQNLLREYLGTRYEYDQQGNTLVKRIAAIPGANEAATLAFAYDPENRLIQATRTWANTVQTAHYAYDALGRRIAKTVTETTNGTTQSATTWFVWDGDALLQEIQPEKTITYLYEPESFVPLARVESAEGQATYAPGQTHLPHVAAWDLPQNRECVEAHVQARQAHVEAQREQAYRAHRQQTQEKAKTSATQDRLHYYHCDHLGTPLELLDDAGKPVWAARYRAWGQVLSYDVREVEQPLRFQGQYLDEETGLHYNRHRYYDPEAARFVSQDPIKLLGGENLFSYGPNSTGWVDPLGLAKKKKKCLDAAECKALLDKINKKAFGRKATDGSRGVLERIEHLNVDHAALYDFAYDTPASKGSAQGKGTYKGHIAQAEDLQRGLKRNIAEYYKGGCKGFANVPREAIEVSALPIPQKPIGR